ncbi:MAG: CDP-glycerol--glycerophosphate glycerophosphotransferase [Gammaproteobacteria bacterium RIFCSPHIGHO2_12_FULL_38_14]|nr:MAG: CDP-glycerol--glycerophosphate glycerophosphotransferase [Gammaproteobacteria bacterium RIFCSPHIGHO2_12_FULL_38_14]
MQFFSYLQQIIRLVQLPKTERRITFYSEGKNYWTHFEGLIQEILRSSNIPICYITSGKDDPGLLLEHPHFKSFKTDENIFRNWIFEHIDTDVMVMTMPDLHQYQVKRSKHNVHYIYVQHSLVSLHMAYRKGAFDHFDTIFCAAPHHVDEIKAIEKRYGLPPKTVFEHGYARLESLKQEAKNRVKINKEQHHPLHVLIAPSWGKEAMIESGVAKTIVGKLLQQGFKTTLRPHPQTTKLSNGKIQEILDVYNKNPLFAYETSVDGQASLHASDVMISDWSGAAFDYAYGLEKPVLFVDIPRKVNNPEYKEISLEPFEVKQRTTIGQIISVDDDLSFIKSMVMHQSISPPVFNLFYSAQVGANYILSILR